MVHPAPAKALHFLSPCRQLRPACVQNGPKIIQKKSAVGAIKKDCTSYFKLWDLNDIDFQLFDRKHVIFRKVTLAPLTLLTLCDTRTLVSRAATLVPRNAIYLQSKSKLLGHFAVFLPFQCWRAKFGELTAITNIGRTRRRTRTEKTVLGGSFV